ERRQRRDSIASGVDRFAPAREDPVKEGVVPGLNRPGGNATGVSFFDNQLTAKRLSLMHDAVPAAKSVAFLVNPNNPNAEPDANDMKVAAAAPFHRCRWRTPCDPDHVALASTDRCQRRSHALAALGRASTRQNRALRSAVV